MTKTSRILSNHLFTALFLAFVVLVKSLPTSVLVDSKQQQQVNHQHHDQMAEQPSSTSSQALNKEKETAPATENPAILEYKNPITVNKAQTKFQKRGVKQNYFDQLNIPAGVWDDPDNTVYPDIDDSEDYQSFQPAFTSPHYPQRPYENFAQMLNPDNLYEEPRALPVKNQYPRFLDERRKRAINKNMMRLKRDSTKLNTADMLKLLEFLEQNPYNRQDNEIDENINGLDYQKSLYGLPPFGQYEARAGAYGQDNDDADINRGEWLNEWVEPSVQYYGNSYGIYEPNPRDRYAASKVSPAKRFMFAKQKRSFNARSATDNTSAKSRIATNFEHRLANNAHRF